MSNRIQFRRDTRARWAEVNPVLMEGEVGLEIDTQNIKMGDGEHAWNDLEYGVGYANITSELGDSENLAVNQKLVTSELAKLGQKQILGEIYDVSAHNNGAVFKSLQILLNSSNLSTLIPVSVRHGGMSIRFIQGSVPSSDNKYVQYRLMSPAWSTTESDWQGVDDEPTVGSENLVKSGGVADSINQLKNAGYLYAGIATPTTNPGTPDGNVFYIANGKGTYTNFGGINVTEDEVVFLYYDTVWHKNATGIASNDKLTELDDFLNGASGDVFTISGKRYQTDGTIVDGSDYTMTKMLPLSIFDNPTQNGIKVKSGAFRMYGSSPYCVAVFFDASKSFIGYSQLTATFSPANPFPASAIPSGAVYVAFSSLTNRLPCVLETALGFVDVIGASLDALSGEIDDVADSVATLSEFAENGIGGVLKGFDVFSADNIFTISGKKRNKTTGEAEDYTDGNLSPLIYLGYLRNSVGDIEIKSGTFYGSNLGVAFFYDKDGGYISCDESSITYSTVTPFPSASIPVNAEFVSFFQYNRNALITLVTYNKPMTQIDNLKARFGISTDYPVVVTPNMTPKAFYDAVNAKMEDFASVNKTYKESFFYVLIRDFTYTWENVLSIVSKNLRQDIGDVNTPMNIVCENVNKALTERVYRFYDAKPLSSAERDASLNTGLNKGEPSAIISDDGGTMYLYANGKRISTNDGVKWSSASDIVKSDGGHTLHEGINYIDGVYYLVAPRQNFGGELVLYTSTDGLNFTYKGKLFNEGAILDGSNPAKSWGNPYIVKNYGDGKFYLYIETQEPGLSWRIHLVIFDDFTTENADGTIGARTIYKNNPVIQNPYSALSKNAQSAGNPDFFKGMDNRPVKVGNKYYMVFHSTHLAIAHLFRASSYDLIHWDIDGIMWDNRDKPSGGDKTSGNADHCIIEFKGRTYLFYSWDINNHDTTNYLKYTIDDRPMRELLKLFP